MEVEKKIQPEIVTDKIKELVTAKLEEIYTNLKSPNVIRQNQPIEHGDYGYANCFDKPTKANWRLFLKGNGGLMMAFEPLYHVESCFYVDVNHPNIRDQYVVKGHLDI